MKILNLVNKEASQVSWEASNYPDGQQNITIQKDSIFCPTPGNYILLKRGPIIIKSRLNNFQDLELIVCAAQSLRNLGVKEIHLYTPYFLGSRSDRKFEEGSNNYLKQVICPIINSLNFESVTVLDPHSSSLECCLNNFKSIDNVELVKFALKDIYRKT